MYLFEENDYLWTTKKEEYVLIKSTEDKYSIFNIIYKTALIIEDDEEYKFVINQMIQNGNRIIRIELLNFILNNRPIPTLIEIQGDKAIYRCLDTGDKLELSLECTSSFEPTFDIGIKWSKNIPLTKQIIYLKKIIPSINLNTPDLLEIARNSSDYIFAESLSHYQAEKIINEGKKVGLELYIISN